jgi:threonine aldolase
MIDLRSDTVTKPTPAMRQAMAEAEVGDDVYREDPTVNLLEERAAQILGKEAALFLPTGTMGNTIGLKVLTEHGQEVIADSRAHILDWELSMLAWFSGCLVRAIPTDDGVLTWDRIRPLVKPVSPFAASTGAIEIENTHNMAGGRVMPKAVLDEICDGAHAMGVPVHLDGARVFNAAEALGVAVKDLVAKTDTVMFSLSKALGAPVGSILAGTQPHMEQARLYRKRLGGGMRQAGVLAAAGLIAIEESPRHLAADHANARYLAGRLAAMNGINVNPVETNIVIFDVKSTGKAPARVSAALKDRSVLLNGIGGTVMRAVTHYDVTSVQCAAAMDALEEVLKA